jgi:hypothetical protein
MRGLLAPNLRGLINGSFNNRICFSCQENFTETFTFLLELLTTRLRNHILITSATKAEGFENPCLRGFSFFETNRI